MRQDIAKKIARGELGIAVLGLGHIGLPTALGFAELGYRVLGADSDAGKVATIKSGRCPFYEPRQQELLDKHLNNPRLAFTADVDEAIRESCVLFICVGTPQYESGQADLTQVEGLARRIGHNLNSYKLIVEKSTVPAVTGQWVKKTVERYARIAAVNHSRTNGSNGNGNGCHGEKTGSTTRVGFEVASNPEFLQEGSAIEDFLHPERIVCGVNSPLAQEILREIYRPIDAPIIFTDLNTAELIKHAANAFLATKVSFINFIANVCEAVGGDVSKVAEGIGLDSRIGRAFLQAGLGFGGYCLPKDVRAFIHLAEEHQLKAGLLREVERINEERITIFLRKITEALWLVRGKTLGVLGIAFKPGTDDIREAPSLKVMSALQRSGAVLQIYDPKAMDECEKLFPQSVQLRYCKSAYEAATGADALLVLTEWQEFRELDMQALHTLMQVPVIIDGRNIYDPVALQALGFEYWSMGRNSLPEAGAEAAERVETLAGIDEATDIPGVVLNRSAGK